MWRWREEFSGCTYPPLLSLKHKSPGAVVHSHTHTDSDAASTSWDLHHTDCSPVCFCLAAASSATSPSHCIPILRSVTRSPSLPLSYISFCRGTAEFLSGATAATLTVLIACSGLGIGHCMTTCSNAVTNQKTNTELLLLCLGQGKALPAMFGRFVTFFDETAVWEASVTLLIVPNMLPGCGKCTYRS